ncbi:MAG: tRNA (N6-threonylcarbamoyladenosine(37)-N6)-methyltransferase TrmO [Actinomycetota bacterium]
MEPITLEPVAYIRHGASDQDVKEKWSELVGTVEVLEPYAEGLTAIDGFSHLILLCWMHRLREGGRQQLVVKPRGLLRHGLTLEELPDMGVFACDAPVRPNPIGLTIVDLLGREGRVLTVKGIDVFDGTPVLDIKPYTLDRAVTTARDAPWHEQLVRATGAKRV